MKLGERVVVVKQNHKSNQMPEIGDSGTIIGIKSIGIHTHNVKLDRKIGEILDWWFEKDELKSLQINKGGEDKMSQTEEGRGLYEINAVVPDEDGELLLEEKVVARDESEAIFASGLKEILKEKKLKKGDVDIIVRRIGNVRPYETVQKVKIVGKMNDFTLCKSDKN